MPRPRPPRRQVELLSVRLDRETYKRWRDRAEFEGITASAAARRAILRELRSDDDRAAS